MKSLVDRLNESILDNEETLINNDIFSNGIYCMHTDGKVKFVYDDNTGKILDRNNNDIEAIGLVLNDHRYWITPKAWVRAFEQSSKNVYRNIDDSNYVFDALNDYDGEKHTALLREYDAFLPIKVCDDYKTPHIDNWYLPSCGEMSVVAYYSFEINNFLPKRMFARDMGLWWTSSIASNIDVWVCRLPSINYKNDVHTTIVNTISECMFLAMSKWE